MNFARTGDERQSCSLLKKQSVGYTPDATNVEMILQTKDGQNSQIEYVSSHTEEIGATSTDIVME